jgi:hypothetical protein
VENARKANAVSPSGRRTQMVREVGAAQQLPLVCFKWKKSFAISNPFMVEWKQREWGKGLKKEDFRNGLTEKGRIVGF